MQSLTFLTFFAASSFATKLLLPLYQYPEGATWDPVYAAIEANPSLIFQIILNVDSGPGGSSPDSNFATGTAKLNSYSNVETLGYVHCLYGEASQDEVNQNVTNWAAWNSYSGANASVGGIFFDETPNTEGGASDVSFMQAVVGAASTAFGSSPFSTMLNPGSSVEHTEFWTLADYIVVYESDASQYTSSVLTTNIPSGKAGQSSILIYDFASTGTEDTAAQWLAEMTAAGVGSAHILDYDYIQATTADTPASIASVAVALAVVPAAGSSADTTTASGAATAPTSVAEPESKTTTVSTTLVTSHITALTTATPPASATTAASDESDPEPAVTSASSAVVVTASAAKPTSTTGGRHGHHHHWRRTNSDMV